MASLGKGDIPIQGDWDTPEEEGKGFSEVISSDDEEQSVYEPSISRDRTDDAQDEETNGDSD